MNKHTTEGMIVFKDRLNIIYHICKIDYTIWEDEHFEYVFTPNYKVIDILPKDEFQGIPGLDLDLRKENYIRKNIEPVFITERSPSEHRIDKWELLDEVDMNHLNRLEWIIRSNRTYSGDSLTAIRPIDYNEQCTYNDVCYRASNLCRMILKSIAEGKEVIIDNQSVNDDTRPIICNLLRSILKSDSHAIKRIHNEEGVKSGRKPSKIDIVSLIRARNLMSHDIMTSDEAAKELGVSRSTMYRLMKKYKV